MSLYMDIEKTFPDFRLSAQLDGGDEVFALLGSSGCGKSLTLKCIAGIEKPDRGRIVINGEVVFDSEKGINKPPQQRQVGYLFQNYALFPNMTVWKNIFCVIQKSKSEREGIVRDIIQKFQLESVQNLYPRQISGGQQQRAALARILVSEPRILMLDEPFSALDTHLKWKMEQEVASVLEEFKGTTIFVSHNRDEAYRISDKIAVMERGSIETIGTKEDVFNSPKTLAAALMTGCKNISRAEKIDDFHVKAVDWGVVLKTNQLVRDSVKHIGVRARHFEPVVDSAEVGANEDNVFACRIHRTIDGPFETTFEFSFDARDTNNADAENNTRLQFEVSKNAFREHGFQDFVLRVPADKIMCLD